MLKTVLSLAAAISVLIASPYTPQMTEIDRLTGEISALSATTDGTAGEADAYEYEDWGETQRYTNRYHGYSIVVPSGMTPDASLAALRFKLDNGSRSIEIYKESFASQNECLTYITYSNRFADDTENHRIELNKKMLINGRSAYIIKWSRDTLGIDDKNHYVNVDIIDGTNVYTIMMKSRADITDYMEIAQSLNIFTPTASVGYMRPFPSKINGGKNAETAALFEKIFGKDAPVCWGLFVPSQPTDGMQLFNSLENQMNTKAEICMYYNFVTDSYNSSYIYGGLTNAWNDGKVCELTLQLAPDAPGSMIYDILKGNYDSYLDAFAADIKRFSHPVMLRLFNEMNGEWCNYSGHHTSRDPEVYIRLYRYIFNKLKSAGCDNVIWIWNPNEKSFPNFAWNSEVCYYPGDEYVDVVGLTGYNTGDYYEGETWRSFDRIYKQLYTHADLLYRKPMMLTEFACSAYGGYKDDWVRDMFAALPKYPNIKAAVWWSSCDYDTSTGNISRSYFIDDTPGVLEIFRENIGSRQN